MLSGVARVGLLLMCLMVSGVLWAQSPTSQTDPEQCEPKDRVEEGGRDFRMSHEDRSTLESMISKISALMTKSESRFWSEIEPLIADRETHPAVLLAVWEFFRDVQDLGGLDRQRDRALRRLDKVAGRDQARTQEDEAFRWLLASGLLLRGQTSEGLTLIDDLTRERAEQGREVCGAARALRFSFGVGDRAKLVQWVGRFLEQHVNCLGLLEALEHDRVIRFVQGDAEVRAGLIREVDARVVRPNSPIDQLMKALREYYDGAPERAVSALDRAERQLGESVHPMVYWYKYLAYRDLSRPLEANHALRQVPASRSIWSWRLRVEDSRVNGSDAQTVGQGQPSGAIYPLHDALPHLDSLIRIRAITASAGQTASEPKGTYDGYLSFGDGPWVRSYRSALEFSKTGEITPTAGAENSNGSSRGVGLGSVLGLGALLLLMILIIVVYGARRRAQVRAVTSLDAKVP